VTGLAGAGKQGAVLALGADRAIDYRQQGWEELLRNAAGPNGYDISSQARFSTRAGGASPRWDASLLVGFPA
jgi:hypothetical protein